MIWKDIPGYEGFYQASDEGQIRSVTKEVRQWSGGTQTKTGKILSPAIDRLGYVKVALSRENKLSTFTVHRLVALCFVQNPEGFKEINHKDANKKNNHRNNLEWCSRTHNIRHAVDNGLIKYHKGDDNYHTIFKEAEHPKILAMHASGLKAPEIGRILGCCYSTIYRIINPLKYANKKRKRK